MNQNKLHQGTTRRPDARGEGRGREEERKAPSYGDDHDDDDDEGDDDDDAGQNKILGSVYEVGGFLTMAKLAKYLKSHVIICPSLL